MNITAQIYLLKKLSSFINRQEAIFDQIFRSLYPCSGIGKDIAKNEHFAEKLWTDFVNTDPEVSAYLSKNSGILNSTTEKIEFWRSNFGIKTITPFDNDYPSSFRFMKNPPWLLYYKGYPAWNGIEFLSVVGSREVTSESLAWMESQLSEFLSESVVGLVSGGARGVDMKAHQLCLRMKRPTVAFLPSGLSKIYPSDFELSSLMVIEQGGAIVSEYEPSIEMRKQYFYARNRLIANLGLMTLIVQAQKRSGTMLSAQHAIENSKPLLVLPAHPLSNLYSGNLKLLSEGATMLCDAQELSSFFESEKQIKWAGSLHLALQI